MYHLDPYNQIKVYRAVIETMLHLQIFQYAVHYIYENLFMEC